MTRKKRSSVLHFDYMEELAAKQGLNFNREFSLEDSYAFCRTLSLNHYENFTVVSRLLPKAYRKYIHVLYAYCRYTDDLGDEYEGDRLEALDRWEGKFKQSIESPTSDHPVLLAVAHMIKEKDVPLKPFLDLIEANRMDQTRNSYSTYDELLRYCDHSANPVGRIFLEIFGYKDKDRKKLSDRTCTGLQLTNFWQDVARDSSKDRIYIPVSDMERFDYSREEINQKVYNKNFKQLMSFEVRRARQLLTEGLELPPLLDGRLKFDVRLFNLGGLAILNKIERINYDVLHTRPILSTWEKTALFLSSLFRSPNILFNKLTS